MASAASASAASRGAGAAAGGAGASAAPVASEEGGSTLLLVPAVLQHARSPPSCVAHLLVTEYDLMGKMLPFLDSQLALHMLRRVEAKNLYSAKSMLQAKAVLLQRTNMVDEAVEACQKLSGSAPTALLERQAGIAAERQRLERACGPLLALVDGEAERPEPFTLAAVQEANPAVTQQHLDSLLVLSKFLYDCGQPVDFDTAATYLFFYGELMEDVAGPKARRDAQLARWGKLAAETMSGHFGEADIDRIAVFDAIRNTEFPKRIMWLQQRVWLLHWSLFAYLQRYGSRDEERRSGKEGESDDEDAPAARRQPLRDLVGFFLEEDCLSAIRLAAPWLMRYAAVGVLLFPELRSKYLPKLVAAAEAEKLVYSDPILEFLRHLHVDFDFAAAKESLAQFLAVVESDVLLSDHQANVNEAFAMELTNSARRMSFELFCRIHGAVDISVLQRELGMDSTEAERWVVEMVREASLEARVDQRTGTISIAAARPNVYQKVVNRSKDLTVRTHTLSSQVDSAVLDVQGRGQRRQGRRR